MQDRGFLLSTLVDFPDDCSRIGFNEGLLAQLMDRLQWMGVRRVYWNYYSADLWQWFMGWPKSPGTRQTLAAMGGDPMAVGCRLAHARGMQFYAVIKPYENGTSHATPKEVLEREGQTGLPGIGGVYRVDPWVQARPELRVRARTADVPDGLDKAPVSRIQLRQKDMTPIRIKPENLEIWTSADNNGYQQRDVPFSFSEGVETCPQDVVDMEGNLVTRQGDPVRTLNLAGLNLLDPFIAITTNFEDQAGMFCNTALEMVRVYGSGDQPLPIVVASHRAVWRSQRDLRTGDLEYDRGLGHIVVCLDVSNQTTVFGGTPTRPSAERDGIIAFAKGRDKYLSGSLCEGYPEVQNFWLGWVSDCILAGVDGVDVRISCHSSWTNTPGIYGFNAPISAEYQRRYGVNPDVEPYDPALLGDLRGDIYDQFLWAVKERLSAAGMPLQLHIEVESFRPDAGMSRVRTRPGNIAFHWRRWLRSGLADETTLFGRAWMAQRLLNDAGVLDVIGEAAVAGVPAHLSEPVGLSEKDGKTLADQIEYSYRWSSEHPGKLAGYTMYETASMFDSSAVGADGKLQFHPGLTEAVHERVKELY
ncbi:MAG: hypothetical protein EXR62_04625 [Chloroflexi bacterium]|nr:hypothetical protein [Chloroflexota bacterium]